MTKIELQILENQIMLMQALRAIGRMLGASDREKIDKIVQPPIDSTMDLIERETTLRGEAVPEPRRALEDS